MNLFKVLAFFLISSFVFAQQLTDDSNWPILDKCLMQNNIEAGTQLTGKNDPAIKKCIHESINLKKEFQPRYLKCKSAASKVLNENEKSELLEFCKINYYQTIPCIDSSYKLKERLTKANEDKKVSIEKALFNSVDHCVTENARYFVGDFCIDFLRKVEITSSELLAVCAEKSRTASPEPKNENKNDSTSTP